jgi:hypothetical protein
LHKFAHKQYIYELHVSRYIYIYKLNDKTEKIYDGQVFIGHSWSCIKKGWNVVTNWQQVILILSLNDKW